MADVTYMSTSRTFGCYLFQKRILTGNSLCLSGLQISNMLRLDLYRYLRDESWRYELRMEFTKPYYQQLEHNLAVDYANGKKIFPSPDLIFNAFNLTPLYKVKVVIVGQDPYPTPGMAMGLAFSVPQGVAVPGSLQNMFKLLANEMGFIPPNHGDLTAWAERGVFLLNTILTVEAGKRNSHADYGWELFTDQVIRIISEKCSGVVFLLFGKKAQKIIEKKIIDRTKHAVIECPHPSPLSFRWFRTFDGRYQCFSLVDEALMMYNQYPMDWSLLMLSAQQGF